MIAGAIVPGGTVIAGRGGRRLAGGADREALVSLEGEPEDVGGWQAFPLCMIKGIITHL